MTAADLARVDVPASQLSADMAALVERQRQQRLAEGVAAEAHHLADPADPAFAALAATHPEAPVSTDADYADGPWPAYIAAQIAKSNQTRRTR